MGLKPPPRAHVVAAGEVTAVVEEWQGQAEGHAPVSDVAGDAAAVVEDDADRVLVVEANVDRAAQAAPWVRW